MFLVRFDSVARHIAATVLIGTLVASSWAQQPQPAPQASAAALPQAPQPVVVPLQVQPDIVKDYSKPRSSFPNVLAPYKPGVVPPPNLSNASRVDQLMHDGKIMLSINDAIALTLENNLDIVLARYNLNIADTDILRAKGGANILGVNTGLVQNTPGGGTGGLSGTVGSGTGGTSVAAGGVGTGTNGLVSSTLGIGAPITSFDPGHQQHASNGPRVRRVDQRFHSRSRAEYEYRHCQFLLPSGVSLGNESVRGIQ